MAYVTPGTVAAGDVATAAAWNVIANDIIAHQAAIRVSQVISTTYATQTGNASSTYTASGLSLAITPSSASSKILVVANMSGVAKGGENANNAVQLRITRDGSSIYDVGSVNSTGTGILVNVNSTLVFLDSPATTSATTYAVEFRNAINTSSVSIQYLNVPSTITLFEILP
jgi:hypothetical protein